MTVGELKHRLRDVDDDDYVYFQNDLFIEECSEILDLHLARDLGAVPIFSVNGQPGPDVKPGIILLHTPAPAADKTMRTYAGPGVLADGTPVDLLREIPA